MENCLSRGGQPNGFVPPAGGQGKCVYRKVECLLLDQSTIHARQRLVPKFSRRRVRQDAAFEPIVVGILTSTVEVLLGSHDNCSQNSLVQEGQSNPASISNLEGSKYFLVRIKVSDLQSFNHEGSRLAQA